MKFFPMPNFKIHSFGKKFQWWSSQLRQMVLTELFRLSDGLANRSFCRSDILRVQLKSNWTVSKSLLASSSKTVWKARLILSKAGIKFLFNGLFGNSFISKLFSKEFSVKEALDDVISYTQETAQTFAWLFEPIIFSIGHFEGPTEVQLASLWSIIS